MTTNILSKKPLTGKFSGILYRGDEWNPHYSTSFAARRALVLHAVNRGWNYNDCRFAFLNPKNPGSSLWLEDDKGNRIPPVKQQKILQDDYNSALAKVMESPAVYDRTEAKQRVGEFIAVANSADWNKRSKRTDYDVLMFICNKMTELGTTRMNLSTRDIAIGAGIVQKTAANSLGRLRKDDWISWIVKGKPDDAGEISLNLSRVQSHFYSHNPRTSEAVNQDSQNESQIYSHNSPLRAGYMSKNETHPSHEIWTRLGKTCKALYASLADQPQTVAQLSVSSGVPRSTAFKNLPKLLPEHLAKIGSGVLPPGGLARKVDDGYVKDLTPDELANAMGWIDSNSKVQQRKELYEDQRIAHKAKLEVYERLEKRK